MSEEPVEQPEAPLTYHQKWYRDNKAAIAARRKERYDTDPEYRKKALAGGRKNKPFADGTERAALETALKLDGKTLDSYREFGLIPGARPRIGEEVFSAVQCELLRQLRDAIRKDGRHSDAVSDISQLAWANWN